MANTSCKNNKGQGLVEFVLILVLIIVVLITVLTLLFGQPATTRQFDSEFAAGKITIEATHLAPGEPGRPGQVTLPANLPTGVTGKELLLTPRAYALEGDNSCLYMLIPSKTSNYRGIYIATDHFQGPTVAQVYVAAYPGGVVSVCSAVKMTFVIWLDADGT